MLTIQKWLEGIGRNRQKMTECPSWPPDLFAVCASLLKRSGTYLRIFERGSQLPDWRHSRVPGLQWRKSIDRSKGVSAASLMRAIPREVLADWTALMAVGDTSLSKIADDPTLSDALIRLTLIADAASDGIGIEAGETPFLMAAQRFLERNTLTSFAWDVPRDSVCVLGKQHTPQRGATLRSLSHNLALYLPNDITGRWIGPYPRAVVGDDGKTLNLLLLPWPERVDSNDFQPARPIKRADSGGSWFEYNPVNPLRLQTFKRRLRSAIGIASGRARRIDAIVFPELALSLEEYHAASAIAVESGIMLIGGVRIPGNRRELGINACAVQAAGGPLARYSDRQSFVPALSLVQSKHHRWCLDSEQARAYQLAGQITTLRNVWEGTQISSRELHFVTLGSWMTWSVLICEDLARQDPAADLIRAVGPNLLIALLMDGPQLRGRWPSRYASVLAEDPGTSVLTLTSLGMAERSRPILRETGKRADAIRAIALWRDIESGEHEIILDAGDNACVLSLVCRTRNEFSADDPVNGQSADFPVFAGFASFRVA
ncbi:MAG: hypothetical protein JWO04_4935 [Gammaproteobacteria bacterium]|nr:hypothetical protein [Gammaproteobacteria bacterium]